MLLAKDVLLRLDCPQPGHAFWEYPSASTSSSERTVIAEATFVDDEGIYLASKSPAALNTATKSLLSCVMEVFGAFGFKITWSKGKTEGILVYRGTRARELHEKLIYNEVGERRFHLPSPCSFSMLWAILEHRGRLQTRRHICCRERTTRSRCITPGTDCNARICSIGQQSVCMPSYRYDFKAFFREITCIFTFVLQYTVVGGIAFAACATYFGQRLHASTPAYR